MVNYRRARDGNTFFFTVVTHQRQPILCLEENRKALKSIINEVRARYPFTPEAWVLLPDHLHCIWKLPEGDSDYSKRWGLIKKEFTKHCRSGFARQNNGTEKSGTARPTRRDGNIWQKRFWERMIRDEKDYAAHCDYIHYNPVKHGWAQSPKDWPYSTFYRLAEAGHYRLNWGASESPNIDDTIGHE